MPAGPWIKGQVGAAAGAVIGAAYNHFQAELRDFHKSL
jgi:hypothetical protein